MFYTKTKRVEDNFFALIIIALSFYIVFVVTTLPFFKKLFDIITCATVGSIFLWIPIVYAAIELRKQNIFAWADFGFTLKNWQTISLEAIFLTVPLLALLTLFKWLDVHYLLHSNYQYPLFYSLVSVSWPHTSASVYRDVLLFAIFATLQEIGVRGITQTICHFKCALRY
jgi:hypothetical protein